MKTGNYIELDLKPIHTDNVLCGGSIEPLDGESGQDFRDKQRAAKRLWRIGNANEEQPSLRDALGHISKGRFNAKATISYILNDERLAPILKHKIHLCLAEFAGMDTSSGMYGDSFRLCYSDIPFIFGHFMEWRDYEIPKPTEQ